MNFKMNLISKINKIKLFLSLNRNKNYQLFIKDNIFGDLTLMSFKYIYIYTIRNINLNMKKVLLNQNSYLKFNLINYLKLIYELSILLRYKDFFFKRAHSSYDLNMLYTLAIINDTTESIFDLNTNSVLNIRKPFKTGTSNLLKKTSLIDAILKKYIESSLDTKVSINFDKYNINFIKKKSIFLKILRRRMRRINRLLRGSEISLRIFIRVTFIFMCTKDLDIFSKVLLKVMNAMHYKNHRRFLYYLKLFITKSMKFYFEVLKFEGFFFYLSGKISGGGNSKKKHYVVKHGKYSLANKMLKLKFKKGLIHTKTGVMGYRFMVSYK